ncbi:MAG: hypothetical protein N2444_08365, partial [Methylocystis sp.]|nr:hypothetical protein [Methylocystis sp.]
LADRELIQIMAESKCVGLFVGIETLDAEMLKRYNKTQNMSKRFNVIDDIEFAESLGILIGYGYLFDPRHQTAEQMEAQVKAIALDPRMPMPVYLSVVAPLAGTAVFWSDMERGNLAPNLRLRDLDGETIAYKKLASSPEAVAAVVEKLFRRPWTVVSPFGLVLKTIRRIIRFRTFNPVRWYIIASASLHCFLWSNSTPSQARSYVAGTDTLDPQYFERPKDLSDEDRARYFDPIYLTDEFGGPAEWLKPYLPSATSKKAKRAPAPDLAFAE